MNSLVMTGKPEFGVKTGVFAGFFDAVQQFCAGIVEIGA